MGKSDMVTLFLSLGCSTF